MRIFAPPHVAELCSTGWLENCPPIWIIRRGWRFQSEMSAKDQHRRLKGIQRTSAQPLKPAQERTCGVVWVGRDLDIRLKRLIGCPHSRKRARGANAHCGGWDLRCWQDEHSKEHRLDAQSAVHRA